MPNNEQQLGDVKNKIKAAIRSNSDRGFVPYGGCNRVCGEMMFIMQTADACSDPRHAFDVYILVLLEAVKLAPHADSSSGALVDVVQGCADAINEIVQHADEANQKHFFNTLLKAAKNKAFADWPDYGFKLLQSAGDLVLDSKQAQKVYDVFPILGPLFNDKRYPEEYLITFGIKKRLEGNEAADQYLMEHLHVPEMRKIAVESALAAKNYPLAEELCLGALKKDSRRFGKPDVWAYYLEQLYAETANEEKLTEMVRSILFHGDTSYYTKLKERYRKQETWDQEREPLLQELSAALPVHEYASLLAKEGELHRLLEVVKRHKSYIVYYGKQLAKGYAEEAYDIYEEYIAEEGREATDRRKYKEVCRIIKSYSEAGAKEKALLLIDRLSQMYPRRPAMLEELASLQRKLL